MTTNKPEVVAWRWRKPVVNDHGETVGGVWELGGAPGFLPWWANEPLVRLSDYEALQAECEKLRKDAARYGWLMQDRHEWPEKVERAIKYRGKSQIDDAIDDAMQGGQP